MILFFLEKGIFIFAFYESISIVEIFVIVSYGRWARWC